MKDSEKNSKVSFSLRVPITLNEKLEERANLIGTSKSAVILNILYEELFKNKKTTTKE